MGSLEEEERVGVFTAVMSDKTPPHRVRHQTTDPGSPVSKFRPLCQNTTDRMADKHRFAFHGFGGWKSEISPWQGISTGTVPGESLLPSS